MNRSQPARLVEGVDYYMEGGRLVFTAAYHRKRGYCCNSRCRHCPWRQEGAGAPSGGAPSGGAPSGGAPSAKTLAPKAPSAGPKIEVVGLSAERPAEGE